jgi:Flp pilus assembly protein TadG
MIVWLAIMVPMLFLPIVGLTMDAGVMFDARRELQNLADGAARVGAMEINEPDLRARDNTTGAVHIAPGRARDSARAYLDRVHFSGRPADIDTQNNRVVVSLTREQRTGFLRLVGIADVTISATGRAAPCSGVVASNSNCN